MAIQPLGSMEQHGPHLPVFTDTVIALEVSRAVADYFKALLLPPIPYSCSLEHRGYRSTVWLSLTTLYSVIRDVVESLKFHGFKIVVIVNGHGANFVLRNIVRELNYISNATPLIILVDLVDIILRIGGMDDLHAGRVETSLMLYLRPNLVKEGGRNYVPEALRDYLSYVPIRRITRDGIWGFPENASKELGREYFNKLSAEAINYIKNVLKTVGYTIDGI